VRRAPSLPVCMCDVIIAISHHIVLLITYVTPICHPYCRNRFTDNIASRLLYFNAAFDSDLPSSRRLH
jgi:hypothetical protein